jgi:hypothetical protein
MSDWVYIVAMIVLLLILGLEVSLMVKLWVGFMFS